MRWQSGRCCLSNIQWIDVFATSYRMNFVMEDCDLRSYNKQTNGYCQRSHTDRDRLEHRCQCGADCLHDEASIIASIRATGRPVLYESSKRKSILISSKHMNMPICEVVVLFKHLEHIILPLFASLLRAARLKCIFVLTGINVVSLA
jgi:hypothetical protein